MTDAVLNDTAAPAEVELTPEQQDAAYEAEFNAAVAKKEGAPAEVADPDTSKEPLDETPSQEAVDPAPKEPAQPAEDPNAALLALVPEAHRDALAKRLRAAEEADVRAKKLEQDNRSMAGRMSAYQRKYEEAAGKRPAEVREAATAEQSGEWKQFAEDYPDIAKAIEARVPATAGVAPEIADVVAFVEQEKRNRFLNDAWEAVESVHAGWKDKARSKEFQDWKQTSPTYEKLAASDDVADAIALFDLYGAHQSRVGSPAVDPSKAAASATIAARRGAQAEGARTPTNRASAPNQSVDLQDEDQLFAFYASKSNARIKARHQ